MNLILRSRLFLIALMTVLCVAIGAVHGAAPAAVLWALCTFVLSTPKLTPNLCVTLTSTEILSDIIEAFKKMFPMFHRMGLSFLPTSLKLNKQYIAHIPSIPSVEDVTSTYNTTGQNARSLLTDVPITINAHKAVHLFWQHFDLIKDDKARYQEVIDLAGYALAKAVIDDLLAGITTHNFSYSKTYAAADFDLDALIDATGTGNTNGMIPTGRTLIVNTACANALSLDSRITSRDYTGQMVLGNALRRWANVGGWAEIIEYPDFPTNNGSALTSVAAEADNDMLTKTAHGLITGDPVVITFGSGFTGLTSGTKYYAIYVDANNFKLATTNANAVAGTAIDITADGTGATVTKSENLEAFGFDRRAIAFLGGPPESADPALAASLGIPLNMAMDTVTYEGITMGAAKWQDTGTGVLHWVPNMIWGKVLGRQGSSNAAGALCDKAGIRFITG